MSTTRVRAAVVAGLAVWPNAAERIASQPSGRACSVSNVSGRVTEADITSIGVSCTTLVDWVAENTAVKTP